MTILIDRLILGLLTIALSVNFYFDYNAMNRDSGANKHDEEWSYGLMMRIIHLENKVDSINSKTIQVAKATMYLDSCQAVKTTKSDRAERRGKFVGGLLRGLFPGI